MRLRANILSAGPGEPEGWRTAAVESVPVFHTQLGRVVGTASDFEVSGDDLWAWLELEDGTPDQARAAGVLALLPSATVRLVAVFYSNWPRELIQLFARGWHER